MSPVALAVLLSTPMGLCAQTAATALISELGCATCHVGTADDGSLMRQRAPSLEAATSRFDGAYIFSYLRNPPVRPGVGASRMPDFRLDDRESLALAAYLSNGKSQTGGAASRGYDRARRANPGVDGDTGGVIYQALRCGACHDDGSGDRPVPDAPDLRLVNRFDPNWLRGFLAAPVALRPFGAVPGSGSRMPDFRLTGAEVETLMARFQSGADEIAQVLDQQPLTAFQQDKAERLVRDRWACLGCHQLDGLGGRIGPDLSAVGARLPYSGIRAMISGPHRSVPGTVMPTRIIPEDRIDLVARYLAAKTAPVESSYLSLIDHAPRQVGTESGGAGLYDRLCANCHGFNGDANGYNARFLLIQPTRHADSVYMATRPDDTLFDGIHVGGFVLNKSHRMPGFGQDLTGREIRSLVQRIRELCHCEGPAWSRDGRREDES